ncbi:MAG: hypothetical protein K2H02_04430, partial [Anaeroplasmataceae bacterium]|nr:hypothetical protein [Anaeroplasmataceae bacterium]
SLTTEYSLKNNVLETITTHDFESNHCSFSMSASKHDTKLLNVSSENINGAKSYTVTLSNPYTTDYILYAFAEANSLANARKRRVTAYCSHIEKESNIRFELRCRLDYISYQKEYSVSFNPLIRGKQFVAIPITLSKNSSGNVILPNNITVYADYSNNNGTCTISNLALTQGEYNYYEYDEAHHKIFESRSEAIHAQTKSCQKEKTTVQKEEITYIYNPKELLEKETHTITTKEYDLSNSLVSNEQDITTMAYAYNKQGKLIKQQSSLGNVVEYVYNEQGTCILKKSYHKSLPNLAYVEEQEVDEDGKVIKEKNELGYSLNYQYLNNSLVSTTTPNGNILYTHESNHAVSISSDVNGLENYNTSIYENGRLVEYKTEGMNYRYTYDEFGREKELYINEKKYCTFERILDKDKINYRTIFSDKSGYQKVCDLYDKVLQIFKIKNGKNELFVSYEYDSKNRVSKEYHYPNGQEEVLEYVYVEDTLAGIKTKDYTKRIDQGLYDSNTIYQMDDNEYSNQTTCDKYGKTVSYKYSKNNSDEFEETYSYDVLDRIKEVNNPLVKEHYTYLSKNGRTTNLISTLVKNIGSKYQRYQYGYDKEGNITFKKENQTNTRYTY